MNRSLRTLLVLPSSFAALVLAAHDASAACATTDPSCSFGPVTGLKASRAQGPDDYVVGFDWDKDFGAGFEVSIGAGLKLVPKDPDAFYSVDMTTAATPPVVQAQWGTDKVIKLTFLDSAKADATFSAHYGLAVQVKFAAKALGATLPEKTWDFTDKITGLTNDDFDFDAQNSVPFKPWGVTVPADMAVVGGSVSTTSLFDVTLADVGLDLACGSYVCATGNLGVYISTEGTVFHYRTVGAKFNGTSFDTSKDMPLPTQADYGDELAVKAVISGGVTVDGALVAKPYISLSSLYGYGPGAPAGKTRNDDGGINWPIAYAAETLDLRKEFTLPADTTKTLTVDYPETTIAIPIPNVKLDKQSLSMTGKSGHVNVNNTGKKAARVSFETKSSGFTVASGDQEIDPGGTYDLQVAYNGADSATGEITIHTNDPDSPVLTLKVGANGAPVGDDGSGDDDDGTSSGSPGSGIAESEDSGCGCHTTPTPGSTGGVLGLALAALAFVRRRRS